jgi:hypothetical protein
MDFALLDSEEAVMLPERQTLGVFDFAAILASNSSTAVQAITLLSAATAVANQSVVVIQH